MTNAFDLESFGKKHPDELVWFSVICQAPSGVTIEEFHTRLSLATLKDFLPDDRTKHRVAEQLRSYGFEVFEEDAIPIICARGPKKLFQAVFLDLRRSLHPVPPVEMPALYIAVPPPPSYLGDVGIPPRATNFELHLPGDIAQLTGAAVTHRQAAGNERATGNGIGIAICDTGFARHPYYQENGYNIERLETPGSSAADDDPIGHGTAILAAAFACAPDVLGYGIKDGGAHELSIASALSLRAPRASVISVSWGWDLKGMDRLPDYLLPLRLVILVAVFGGTTVVAVAGNGEDAFPGMLPEVISVGGVAVDESGVLTKWHSSSAYTSSIFPRREVPDLCGMSSGMLLPRPAPQPGAPYRWYCRDGGTSSAAPQIAAICALLLQKNSSLSPASVRNLLRETATPVGDGTGAGLVNAFAAWNHV